MAVPAMELGRGQVLGWGPRLLGLRLLQVLRRKPWEQEGRLVLARLVVE